MMMHDDDDEGKDDERPASDGGCGRGTGTAADDDDVAGVGIIDAAPKPSADRRTKLIMRKTKCGKEKTKRRRGWECMTRRKRGRS